MRRLSELIPRAERGDTSRSGPLALVIGLALVAAGIPLGTDLAALQVDDCCNVVSVDQRGVVTARELTSNRTFTFRVGDASLLRSLQTGQRFNTDPALSSLRQGATFSLLRTAQAAPVGRAIRGIVRPTVTRLDRCCSLVSTLTANEAPAGAAARLPAKDAVSALAARGGIAVRTPEAPEPVNYAIDLIELHCRKIWYSAIGERDRVLLELWAFDAGSDQKGIYVAHTFNCRNDTKQNLDLEPIFAAAGLKGDVWVSGNFMVTHPQNGQNIVKALRDLAELEATVAEGIATSGLVETGSDAAKLVATFTGEGVRDKIVQWRGNFFVELFNVLGRAVCGGGNPRTWTKSIGLNPLGSSFFDEWGGTVYKLWYISEGAKPETCFREIKYDLFARIRAN